MDLVIRCEERIEPVAFMSYSTSSMMKEILGGTILEDLCGDSLFVECMEKIREKSLVMTEFSTKEDMHVKLISKKKTKERSISISIIM